MKLTKLAKKCRDEGSIPVIAACVILLAWYQLSLADYLGAPPSADFSRELPVAKLAYGDNENTEYHIAAMALPDSGILIAAVDGPKTRLIELRSDGSLAGQTEHQLDLSQTVKIGLGGTPERPVLVTSRIESGSQRLGVIRIAKNGTEELSIAVSGFSDFRVQGQFVLLQFSDKLELLRLDGDLETRPISSGAPITSSALYADKEQCYAIWVENHDGLRRRRMAYIEATTSAYPAAGDAPFNILVLGTDSRDDYTGDVRALRVDEELVSALYVWTDRRDGVNYLTVTQYGKASGEQRYSMRARFPIHRGRFDLTASAPGSAAVLMQTDTLPGVNLVSATLSHDQAVCVTPLTRTRAFTKLSEYIQTGNQTTLVFCEFDRNKRELFIASNNPDTVRMTIGIVHAPWLQVLMNTALILGMALFMSGIGYIAVTSALPALLLVLSGKSIDKPGTKMTLSLLAAAFLHNAAKFAAIHIIITRTPFFDFRPLLWGRSPWLYLVAGAGSLLSAWTMFRRQSQATHPAAHLQSAFTRYIISDFFIFTLTVFVYVCTNMILGKL